MRWFRAFQAARWIHQSFLKTGDPLPGTAAVVEGFGLIDAVNGEHYARAAVEAVEPLVHHGSQNVKAAALRVLLDLEQDEWLRQQPWP
jgi:hypothetical protein